MPSKFWQINANIFSCFLKWIYSPDLSFQRNRQNAERQDIYFIDRRRMLLRHRDQKHPGTIKELYSQWGCFVQSQLKDLKHKTTSVRRIEMRSISFFSVTQCFQRRVFINLERWKYRPWSWENTHNNVKAYIAQMAQVELRTKKGLQYKTAVSPVR